MFLANERGLLVHVTHLEKEKAKGYNIIADTVQVMWKIIQIYILIRLSELITDLVNVVHRRKVL